ALSGLECLLDKARVSSVPPEGLQRNALPPGLRIAGFRPKACALVEKGATKLLGHRRSPPWLRPSAACGRYGWRYSQDEARWLNDAQFRCLQQAFPGNGCSQ